MQIYMNAMKQCYNTLRAKKATQPGRAGLKYQDFAYFCFHTPFSKMVQKSFIALILADIEANFKEVGGGATPGASLRYERGLVEQLAQTGFKNDQKANAVLMKAFGAEWKDKCERSLKLAKELGNIYTGSLYNGLLSLVCDESISLAGKEVLMFSYGSGCAASMFVLRFRPEYSRIRLTSAFQDRLARRVRVSAEEYSRWMDLREQAFGKPNFTPTVSPRITHRITP